MQQKGVKAKCLWRLAVRSATGDAVVPRAVLVFSAACAELQVFQALMRLSGAAVCWRRVTCEDKGIVLK